MILMTVDYVKKSQKCNFQKVKNITYKYRMNGRKTFLQFINEVVSRMVKLVQSSTRMGATSTEKRLKSLLGQIQSGQCPRRVKGP